MRSNNKEAIVLNHYEKMYEANEKNRKLLAHNQQLIWENKLLWQFVEKLNHCDNAVSMKLCITDLEEQFV